MFLRMFKAAVFLVSICYCVYWCHGCMEEERRLLLQIKDSINYPHDSSLEEDWVGKNCCQWIRVECNPSSSRVISINLDWIREERLDLWYPNASLFAQFKELKELDLSGNQIGGWVMPQGLCELKKLRNLYLDYNNLDGKAIPPCLTNLSMLETLTLHGNHLGYSSGALTVLSKMQNLRTLDLGANNLYASINSLRGICELTALQNLDLYYNGLNDNSIPKCLGNLSSLEVLELSGNELRGLFGSLSGLCGLKALKTLDLQYNYLNHNDHSGLSMCLGNFSLLEELYLSENNLNNFFGNSIKAMKP